MMMGYGLSTYRQQYPVQITNKATKANIQTVAFIGFSLSSTLYAGRSFGLKPSFNAGLFE